MAELYTKLVHRNDTTEKWSLHGDKVLLKGETGIEFLSNGKVKVKIGDGVTEWRNLPYFGDAEVVENLAGLIGEVTDGKTIVEMIADAQAAATYDDTALVNRVKTIEDDCLKAADKTELEGKITTAKTEAIAEAVAQVLGEGVDEKYDTLVEIANWIISDSTSSAELVAKVNEIYGDYLKGADKTELQGAISALEQLVGELPEGAASSTVIEYIHETIEALKIGDYAKAVDLTELAGRVTTAETKLAEIEDGAQVNKVETVDANEFSLIERQLSIKAVPMDKIAGLEAALEDKVEKVEGARLMTSDEATKLEKLVMDEDGSVSISGTVAAGNVDGLDAWITARAGTLKGLSENNLSDTLLEKIEESQANVLEAVQVNGSNLTITDKAVNIKSTDVVKATAEITVAEDGTLGIGKMNVDKLEQTEGTWLILNGGTAAD